MKEQYSRVGFISGPLQAEIFKDILASLGIDCILLREGASVVYGIVSGPLADIEVLVPAERLQEAIGLLEDFNAGRLSITFPSEATEEGPTDEDNGPEHDEEGKTDLSN